MLKTATGQLEGKTARGRTFTPPIFRSSNQKDHLSFCYTTKTH